MASTALQLQRCLTDVGHRMTANSLKLNADKTKLLWVGLSSVLRPCQHSIGYMGDGCYRRPNQQYQSTEGTSCSGPDLGDSLSLGNRCPKLQLGGDTIFPTNDVKVLGVTLSSDLTMDKHVLNVCSAGFYRLRQLRRVLRSLDTATAATLVHAFVTPRIDYCNVLLAGAPKATTDKLQRLLYAAARFLVARRSLIVDCPCLCMSTFIGSMFRSE